MSHRCFTLLTSVLLLSACDGFLTGPDDSVEVIGEVTATRDVPTALYLGTQHRLTLRVPDDTDPAEVFVAQGAGSGADVAIERRSDTQIDILPGRTGDLILELTDPDGEIQGTSRFEVRRVPDPVVELNGSLGGSINFQEFRDEVGLTPTLGDFPFEAKCDVDGFEMTYIQSRQDPVSVQNDGARFSSQTLSVTVRAIPGDIFLINNVRVTCAGDSESRTVNSLALFIQ